MYVLVYTLCTLTVLVCTKLPVKVTLGVAVVTVRNVNLLNTRFEANVRHDTKSRTSSGRVGLGHRLASRDTVSALLVLAGDDDAVALAGVASLSDESGVLVEDVAPVGLDALVLAGDVLIEDGDDSDLSHVFDHVALSIGVRDVGVLVKVVPPRLLVKFATR